MCKFNPKNDSRRIDPCMKNIIELLNRFGCKTVDCCCGHGKYHMTIIVKSTVVKNKKLKFIGIELFSGKYIPRIRKFYKKDRQGYYFVPEAMEYWKTKDNISYNQSQQSLNTKDIIL